MVCVLRVSGQLTRKQCVLYRWAFTLIVGIASAVPEKVIEFLFKLLV